MSSWKALLSASVVVVAALPLTFASSGCSSDEESPPPDDEVFDVSGYDRACATPADCIVVFSGDPCGCSCDSAAIASAERAQYDEDHDAFRERNCPEGALQCGACAAPPALECNAGQCALAP